MAEKPFGRTYLVAHLPVVRGGPARPYLNVGPDTLRSLALAQLQNGECVYFGCDVAQMTDAEAGVLHDALYDLTGVLGVPVGLTKAQRLDYGGEIAGGHQMVFAGVHVVDGAPARWKVENSWGTERGKKGYFVGSCAHLLYRAVRQLKSDPPAIGCDLSVWKVEDHSAAEQIMAAAAVHGALDRLQSVD